jgi:hypothetical protein
MSRAITWAYAIKLFEQKARAFVAENNNILIKILYLLIKQKHLKDPHCELGLVPTLSFR